MNKRAFMCLLVVLVVSYTASVWGYTESDDNNFFGDYAGPSTTGTNNTFIGAYAGNANIGGSYNSFIGVGAGYNSTGDYNTFFGYAAGNDNVGGSNNVFIGSKAGYQETGSNKLYIDNCFNGTCDNPLIYGEFNNQVLRINGKLGVGKAPVTALDVSGTVTATGYAGDGSGLSGVLTSETDPKVGSLINGKWCTSNGSTISCQSDAPVTTETDPEVGTLTNGKWCTSNGSTISCQSDAPVTTETDPEVGTLTNGKWCTSNGSNVSCTADVPVVNTGDGDTFVGASAGYNETTGFYNSFLGVGAGYSITTGNANSFFGAYAGYNSTASLNSFFGTSAGYSTTTGSANSFLGAAAGYSNNGGHTNSFLGNSAGYSNTEGNFNSLLGASAGYSNTTGSANVFLGYRAGFNETGSNRLYIDNCFTGSNCTSPLIYGEFDNRVIRIDGRLEMITVATPSDVRYKKNIHAIESPLQNVLKLQGVTYEWDMEKVKGAGFREGRQIGVIAQKVEEVLPELVYTDSKGYKTVAYDKLAPVLIEAVKEMQARHVRQMQEKDDRIAKLERSLERMEKRLASLEGPLKKIALK